MIACGPCERALNPAALRDRDHGTRLLAVGDYCGWCARPISESAMARAPLQGFIALAKALSGDRHPAFAHGGTREDA